MSLSHRFLKTARTIHLYLGVFTAPMLLFFAVTGGLQTFGLHESGRGSNYKPPAWLATMAQLHKKQTIVVPARRLRLASASGAPASTGQKRSPELAQPSASSAPAPSHHDETNGPAKNLWPMKIFFAVVALGLLVSVLSGLYMAWRYSRRPRLFGTILGAGVIVPLLLLI
ncbi:MAG: PepSY domain-containing protein [Rhodanobacter sp.]